MNDVAPSILVPVSQIINATAVKGIHFKSVGRHGKQTVRFVHHQKLVIFKRVFKVNVRSRLWRRCTFICSSTLEHLNRIASHDYRSIY